MDIPPYFFALLLKVSKFCKTVHLSKEAHFYRKEFAPRESNCLLQKLTSTRSKAKVKWQSCFPRKCIHYYYTNYTLTLKSQAKLQETTLFLFIYLFFNLLLSFEENKA